MGSGDEGESNPVIEDEVSFKAQDEPTNTPTVLTQRETEDVDELDSDEEAVQADLQHRRAEILKLQGLVQQKAEDESKRAKNERRRLRMLKAEEDRADLERQERTLHAQSRGFSAAGAAGVEPSANGTRKKTIDSQVAEHEARRQRRAAEKLEKRKSEQAKAAGLSMASIRKIPEVREKVDKYIGKLKSKAPTLASDNTASNVTNKTVQPANVQIRDVESDPQDYVYVAELGRVVPVVARVADLSGKQEKAVFEVNDDSSDEECSADDDCDVDPGMGNRLAWRRDADGSKYFEMVEDIDPIPVMEKTYVLNKKTNRYECKYLPVQIVGSKKSTARLRPHRSASSSSARIIPHQYKDHRVRSGSTRLRTRKPPVAATDDRVPSFVQSESEKQGKGSIPDLVHYARECPVAWTSKITTQNMNVVLWSWAYVSQLLSSRIGQAPALEEGELEARLQHFLSVLEVTLQTTAQTDFASDAWKVARLYHSKVQQKLDNGVFDWLQMYEQWGGSTLPHKLMAANAEVAPVVRKARKHNGGEEAAGLGLTGRSREERQKRVCLSYNKCETRGKCQYEVDNDGEKCKYAHFCSHCKAKKLNPVNHQKLFCRRVEDETD